MVASAGAPDGENASRSVCVGVGKTGPSASRAGDPPNPNSYSRNKRPHGVAAFSSACSRTASGVDGAASRYSELNPQIGGREHFADSQKAIALCLRPAEAIRDEGDIPFPADLRFDGDELAADFDNATRPACHMTPASLSADLAAAD